MDLKKKRFLPCILLVLMLGLAACGGKKGGAGNGDKDNKNAEELVPEFSYVANFMAMPDDVQAYNAAFGDKAMYYVKTDFDEETYQSSSSIQKISFENGSFGSSQKLLDLSNGEYVNKIVADASDNLYLYCEKNPEMPEEATEEELDQYYQNAYANTKRLIVKLDGQGQKVYETDITELVKDYDYFYPEYFVVDDLGRAFLCSYDTDVFLFDEQGIPVGTAEINTQNGWMNAIGIAKDGKAYVAFQQYTQDGSENLLYEIDFDGKKIGKTYKNVPASNGNGEIVRGKDCDVLFFDSSAVYEYSIEKEEGNKILTWLDCDIDGSLVSALIPGADGKMYAILNDYETGAVEMSELVKVRTEDIAKREVITVGVIYENSSLARKIVEFNKSNDQYRIKMKAYMDANDWSDTSYNDAIANLTNDLVNGAGPDILDLSSLDIENLTSKGVLEDLMPYLEKSNALSKSDFFDRILEAATYDGKLTYLASGFTLETLAAKTSIVGNKMGWTLNEMKELKKAWPNSELMEYATRESVLYMMMIMNKSAFLDTSKAECNFDSAEFKSLLEFAKSFPEDYDYENQRLTPFKLKDNSLILTDASIYGFDEIQSISSYFDGEAYTFIGYPTSDGGNGCILNPIDQYGMAAKSEHKDAAWAFLESLLTSQGGNDWRYGFSSLKKQFEADKAKALDVKYLYDENGEIMKDEDGNPMYENAGGGWSMIGDDGEEWNYVYRPVTKEEADMVDKLLEKATVINVSMDTELNKIITEEAQYYFQGNKSVDDVANVIQNRVNLYLKENY